MECVLESLADITGIIVRYALRLADKQTLEGLYGKDMQAPCDHDAYGVGPVILSDLGYDGTYSMLPESLSLKILKILVHSYQASPSKQ